MNYPEQDWVYFGQLLSRDPKALSSSDRASLINDAFSLTNADRLAYSTALSLTQYLEFETSLAPWSAALAKLCRISDIIYFTDVYPAWNKFLENLVLPLYRHFGGNWREEERVVGVRR